MCITANEMPEKGQIWGNCSLIIHRMILKLSLVKCNY